MPNRDEPTDTERGPLGDARPDAQQNDPRANHGQPPEDVEDRPSVGQEKPEDYPEEERNDAQPD